jgi:hypothetical protein
VSDASTELLAIQDSKNIRCGYICSRALVSTVIDPAGSSVGWCCPADAGSVEDGSSLIKTQ